MIYAQINEDSICIAVSEMEEIGEPNPYLVKIEKFDISILGKKYNNGVWEEGPQPEPEPLSKPEQTVLDIAINSEYLVCLADLNL